MAPYFTLLTKYDADTKQPKVSSSENVRFQIYAKR